MSNVRYVNREVDSQHVIDEIHKIVVHTFSISDNDDPEIYAAEPIWNWQQTDKGKFVMKNAYTVPEFHRMYDISSLSYKFAITAEFEKKILVEFYLKWGKSD